jgi:hypothetical protein
MGTKLGLQQSLALSLLLSLSSYLFSLLKTNESRYKDLFTKEGLLELFPPSYLLSLIYIELHSMVV